MTNKKLKLAAMSVALTACVAAQPMAAHAVEGPDSVEDNAAPQAEPALVHELHVAAGHMFCRLTDYYLFENAVALTPYLQGRHITEV